jgi:peptidoglycan/xylan/chitin deacetylase (PgdA/CDA1 family)
VILDPVLRRRARHALRAERPIVLMYHRVAVRAADPWQLAVAPSRFADQIAALMAARTVVPLSWLAVRLAAGRLPRHTAAVTFDDGYVDVWREARPVLEAAGCPATVFVTTGAVDAGTGFWWDVLARIVLESAALPERIAFTLAGRPHGVQAAGDDRGATLATLHGLLRTAAPGDRDDALAEIAACIGADSSHCTDDRAMNAAEVSALGVSGLIEIGAHTLTHPAMTGLTPAEQAHEAAASRARCEEISGRPVTLFAYPYGDHDEHSIAAVRDAGLACACTTVNRDVRRGEDPLALPRVLVADWDRNAFRDQVLVHG